jgi:hypothetical protein
LAISKGKGTHKVRPEDFTQADEVQELPGRLRSACEGKQLSDIIDARGNQYVDLVISAGSINAVLVAGLRR